MQHHPYKVSTYATIIKINQPRLEATNRRRPGEASVVSRIRFDNGMLQGPPHPRAPRSPRPPRGGWILLPSPLWGRGWRASGVIASRGGPGEGVSPIVNSYVGHHTRGKKVSSPGASFPGAVFHDFSCCSSNPPMKGGEQKGRRGLNRRN